MLKKSIFYPIIFAMIFLLVGCSKSDPQAKLDQAADELQAALEAKDTSRVLDMLHEHFTAQSPSNDKEWARRTMAAMFLSFKNIKIVAVNVQNRIDEKLPVRATSQGEVMVMGAEGLIPDSASRYRVEIEWREEGGEWKVIHIKWQ